MFATAGANVFANEMLRYNPFQQPEMSDVKRGKPGAKTAATIMDLRGTVVDG